VLRDEVDWTLLPVSTPRELVELLKRCLEKDPIARIREADEVRERLSSVQVKIPLTRAAAGRRWVWIVLAVLLAAGILIWVLAARP
jgi:hypothetical protein